MKQEGGVARFDINDDADMAVLIRTGLVWKGGPATVRKAMEYLKAHPEAVNDKVPANVLAVLQPQPDQTSVPPGAPVPQAVEQAPSVEQAPAEAPVEPPVA
jgi:hypothetical protein